MVVWRSGEAGGKSTLCGSWCGLWGGDQWVSCGKIFPEFSFLLSGCSGRGLVCEISDATILLVSQTKFINLLVAVTTFHLDNMFHVSGKRQQNGGRVIIIIILWPDVLQGQTEVTSHLTALMSVLSLKSAYCNIVGAVFLSLPLINELIGLYTEGMLLHPPYNLNPKGSLAQVWRQAPSHLL